MSESARPRQVQSEGRSTKSSTSSDAAPKPEQLRKRLLALILKNEAARKAPAR